MAGGPKPVALNKKARIDRVHDMQATEFKQVQASRYLHSVVASAKVIELTNISKGYGERTQSKTSPTNLAPKTASASLVATAQVNLR